MIFENYLSLILFLLSYIILVCAILYFIKTLKDFARIIGYKWDIRSGNVTKIKNNGGKK